jgi:predicted house-cleaning noncanonical NTP pyrophosphatase (MazG superfamily)
MATEKLVRDKIPEIIRAKGESCVARVAGNNRAFYEFLLQKLEEEKGEFFAADSAHVLEECADMHEVICGLAELFGHTREELLRTADKKREERGGFSGRIIMRIY